MGISNSSFLKNDLIDRIIFPSSVQIKLTSACQVCVPRELVNTSGHVRAFGSDEATHRVELEYSARHKSQFKEVFHRRNEENETMKIAWCMGELRKFLRKPGPCNKHLMCGFQR